MANLTLARRPGSTLLDIKWNLLAMALWGAALITVATMTFRFQDKEAV